VFIRGPGVEGAADAVVVLDAGGDHFVVMREWVERRVPGTGPFRPLMNDSVFGLTASIWTADVDAALAVGDRVETGPCYLNSCDYLDRDLDDRWGRSAAAEAIELAAVPLGGAPGARIPAERRGVPQLGPRRRLLAMVDDALGGKWRSHPLVDGPHHLEDTSLPCESGLDTVAHPHRRCRLGRLAVHAHVPAAARRCGRHAGLDRSHRPEPPVHARRITIARARHERQATATARGLPTTARHRVELLGAGP
jgi:Aldehyde dehydrogenase family